LGLDEDLAFLGGYEPAAEPEAMSDGVDSLISTCTNTHSFFLFLFLFFFSPFSLFLLFHPSRVQHFFLATVVI
jgi:hypothetical protein